MVIGHITSSLSFASKGISSTNAKTFRSSFAAAPPNTSPVFTNNANYSNYSNNLSTNVSQVALPESQEEKIARLIETVWKRLQEKYEALRKIDVIRKEGSDIQMPAYGEAVNIESPYYQPADSDEKDSKPTIIFPGNWSLVERVLDERGGKYIKEIFAERFGVPVSKIKGAFLVAIILCHECGHATDKTLKEDEDDYKPLRDAFGASNLAEFNKKYPDAPEEKVRAFVRAFRNLPHERIADDFAINFISTNCRDLFKDVFEDDSNNIIAGYNNWGVIGRA